jgi:hypothetical protein
LLLRSSKSLTEAIQLHDESMAGNADTVKVANRILERIIGELGEAYRQVDRLQEAEYCLRRLNKKRPAN